jgi:putative FmdB family regulatory protein
MPIYAYRCESCGFGKDVLQKLSDAPLTQCPECGKATFAKQVTAAGFQLKGSGWYVTDFRGGNNGGKPVAAETPKSDDAASKPDTASAPADVSKSDASKSDASKSDASKSDAKSTTAGSTTAAPASTPSSGNA